MKPATFLAALAAAFAALAATHAVGQAPQAGSGAAGARVQVFASGRSGLKSSPVEQFEEASKPQELFCGRTHTSELAFSIPKGMEVVAPVARWTFDATPSAHKAEAAVTTRHVTASGTISHEARPGASPLCGTATLHLRYGLVPSGGSKGEAFVELAAGSMRAGLANSRLTLPISDDRVIERLELAFEGAAKRVVVPADASEDRPYAFTQGKRRYLAWRAGRELFLSDITR